MKNKIKAALSAMLLCGFYASSQAQDASKYLQAAREFTQLAAKTQQERHRMPRLSDPEAGGLIATLSDSARFVEAPHYQVQNAGRLAEVCSQANAVTSAYALFDATSRVDAKAAPATQAQQMQALAMENITAYQDELELLQPFMFRCLAKQMPLLAEFVHALTPEQMTAQRRLGIEQLRNGAVKAYGSVLVLIRDPRLKFSFRQKLLLSLADTVEQFSIALPPPARHAIAELAKSAKATASEELQISLDKIISAMSDSRCDDLCKW